MAAGNSRDGYKSYFSDNSHYGYKSHIRYHTALTPNR